MQSFRFFRKAQAQDNTPQEKTFELKLNYWNAEWETKSVGHISMTLDDQHLGFWPTEILPQRLLSIPFLPIASPAVINTSLKSENEIEKREPTEIIKLIISETQKNNMHREMNRISKEVDDGLCLYSLLPRASMMSPLQALSKRFDAINEDPFTQTSPVWHSGFDDKLANNVKYFADNGSVLNCVAAVNKILAAGGIDLKESMTPSGFKNEIDMYNRPSLK